MRISAALAVVLVVTFVHATLVGPTLASQGPRAAITIESLVAEVTITDGLATTSIEQVFRNHGPTPAEESYLWPIPEGAAVSSFSLWIDGKETKGEVLDGGAARGVYLDIVRRQRDPGLLEWVGHGCVRASIFPIEAGGTARVRLRYQSVLSPSAAGLELELPLRLGALVPGDAFTLVASGTITTTKPLGAVQCTTHAIDVVRSGAHGLRWSMEETGSETPRDLRLALSPAVGDFGAMLVAHREAGEPGTFLLTVSPRGDATPAQRTPIDAVFVLDVSGSMRGEKLEQALRAVGQCLDRLAPDDRFEIVRFATDAQACLGALQPATPETLARAREWLAGSRASGGTNLAGGLAAALAAAASVDRRGLAILVSDGAPTVGERSPAAIVAASRAQAPARLRLFSFGVGDDVNADLLDRLVEECRGAREYVRPGEVIDAKVVKLFEKASHPVLESARLDVSQLEAFDVDSLEPADLFRGAQVVASGRFRATGPRRVTLLARVGGEEREWHFVVDLPAEEERHGEIPALWARRRAGRLLDALRLHGPNDELVDEVGRLALQHGIVTPYTSHLVLEDVHRLGAARGVGPPRSGQLRYGSFTRERPLPYPPPADGVPGPRTPGPRSPAGPSGPTTPAVGGPVTGPSGGGGWLARDPAQDLLRGGSGSVARSIEIQELSRGFSGGEGNPQRIQRVGGKVFHRIGGVWVDAALDGDRDREPRKVGYLSPEYFALLEADPRLAPFLALGECLVLLWKGVAYEIS